VITEPTRAASSPCAECGRGVVSGPTGKRCDRCTIALACTVADEVAGAQSALAGIEPLNLGRYELLQELGRGGMGVVWKANDAELQRVVAIKFMHPWVYDGEQQRKRLLSEARAAAQLQHPGLVAVYEIGEHAGRPFIVMEYVDGTNLGDIIAETPLAADRAARYLVRVAEAMHYAHERGVLHRDLKPNNILIDRNELARVFDFGLARHNAPQSQTSSANTLGGTLCYMPPEQAEGRGERMDRTSDVYALGATLYACLTSRPPFIAETPLETLRQVLEAEPSPPRALNRDVPLDAQQICLKCLAKDPRQRYATAHALAQDLGRFLRREPIVARPPALHYRVRLFARRHPAFSALLSVAGLLLGMMAGSAWLFRHDALDSNVQAARLAAGSLLGELALLGRAVESRATDRELAAEVAHGSTPTQYALLQRAFESQLFATARLGLRSWLLLDDTGKVLASWPARERRTDDRSFRDYYLGAVKRANQVGRSPDQVYYSRVFRSLIDGAYNFGISHVVRGEHGSVVGVLVAFVGTSSTESIPGFSSEDRKTVLAARCDDPPPRALAGRPTPTHVIMLHPAFHGRTEAIAAEHRSVLALLAERADVTFERDGDYRDPARILDPRYGGSWLAGFARVAGTPFVVIFQTRDWVGNALRLGGLLLLGLCAIWLLARVLVSRRALFRR
jgi:predicted Ser/Thr protein kinase